MGASAGRYGVSIGTGAAGGAGAGAAFGGPIGAVVGGGIGALGGALSTLLSSSDEAKQRQKALEAYKQQQLEASQNDWDRRWAAMTGISNNPAYLGLSYRPYDPQKAESDFNAHTPDEPTPNYGALVQSLGSLGGTVGALGRQSDLQDKLGLAQINATKNPWQADASTTDPGLEKLLEQARQAAWNRTGGW